MDLERPSASGSDLMPPGAGGSRVGRRVLARHVAMFALSLALSGVILAFLWYYKGVRFDALASEWHRAAKGPLVATILASAAFHVFVGAHKLASVLRAMGVDIGYREVLLVRLGGGPLRVLVPLKAGEMLNVVYFWRHKRMPFGRASGAAVFDRGLNILGAVIWLAVGLALLPEAWPETWPRTWAVPGLAWEVPVKATLFLGAAALYIVFFFCTPIHGWAIRLAGRVHPKIGRLAEGMLAPLREFSFGRKVFFTVYGVVFQLRPLLVCMFLFRVYGVHPDLVTVIAYMSVAVIAAHLPGFIAGMGPRETAMVTLFAGLAPAATLFSIGLLQTFTVHIIPMLVGLPWSAWFVRRLVKREEKPAADERP